MRIKNRQLCFSQAVPRSISGQLLCHPFPQRPTSSSRSWLSKSQNQQCSTKGNLFNQSSFKQRPQRHLTRTKMSQILGKQSLYLLNIRLSCVKMLLSLEDVDMERVADSLTIMKSLQLIKQPWKQKNNEGRQIRIANLSLL